MNKLKLAGRKRDSFSLMRPLENKKVEVTFHYYPDDQMLCAIMDNHLQYVMSGPIAKNRYEKLKRESPLQATIA